VPKSKRTESEWITLVREWRASGLKQREFAESVGVSQTSLSRWARRVGGARVAPGMFVPVDVVGAGAADFRVELRGGRVLHVPASFDEGGLRRLLAVLERAAC
jgi:hypothetical protein